MPDSPNETTRRVARLAPFLLEVVEDCPAAPWDRAISTHGKRRDAERAAKEPANVE
jgi:hypothetical protein